MMKKQAIHQPFFIILFSPISSYPILYYPLLSSPILSYPLLILSHPLLEARSIC